jgi:CheY-like chemotaxis protein
MTVRNERDPYSLRVISAHDMKNILAALIANAELLAEGNNNQEDQNRIDRILTICAKGVSLIDKIRANSDVSSRTTAVTDSCTTSDVGHILLVEDEAAMLELESRILRSQGYKVTSCLSAGEAFSVFLEDPNAIDLVLTDQEMPGRTGMQLLREIHGICPEMACILITGDGGFLPENGNIMECCALLIKPVSRTDLLAAVGKSLEP